MATTPRRVHPVTFFKDGDPGDPNIKDFRAKPHKVVDAVHDEQPADEAEKSDVAAATGRARRVARG